MVKNREDFNHGKQGVDTQRDLLKKTRMKQSIVVASPYLQALPSKKRITRNVVESGYNK